MDSAKNRGGTSLMLTWSDSNEPLISEFSLLYTTTGRKQASGADDWHHRDLSGSVFQIRRRVRYNSRCCGRRNPLV